MAEMGRRSRRSSCVSFSISQRDNRCDDRDEGEEGSDDDDDEEEEAIPGGRTSNEDHED